MNHTVYRVGSRQSDLAMVQTQWALQGLTIPTEIQQIISTGDRVLDRPLSEVGGKGAFCRELEQALLASEVDCVIHSAKDVPTHIEPGTTLLGCVWQRGDRRDCVLSAYGHISQIPSYSRVGTSSARRAAQFKLLRPDVDVVTLRGNIGTRLKKLINGEYSAIIMAECAVQRLNLLDTENNWNHPTWSGQHWCLDPQLMLPAAGAGCVVVQIRERDQRSWDLWQPFLLPKETVELWCERAVLAGINGDCDTAAGVVAQVNNHTVSIQAGWWDQDVWWQANAESAVKDWKTCVQQVVDKLWAHTTQNPPKNTQ
jgi:hydroxymethylbilane synthase